MDCVKIEGRAYVAGSLKRVKIGGSCKTIQFSDKYLILPGMVDIHVHFRDWGLAYKETLAGGSMSALAGGVVAVGDMPNTKPHIKTAELYAKRLREGAELPIVYRLHMGLPEDLTQLEIAKPHTLKIYPEDIAAYGWGHVKRALEKCAELGCTAIFHCEDPAFFKNGVRPPEAELACVEKLRRLKSETGSSIHITHVTLPQTAEVSRGWATVDVTPHHLYLDGENCREGGLCRVNPPLRTPEVRKKLLAALVSGLVDIYATDHAPHTIEEKTSENPPPGICSLEIALSLLLTLWRRGVLSLGDVVRLYSKRPARFLGLDMGLDMFTIVKLEEWEVRGVDFLGKCKFTPLERRRVFGRVVATAVGGKIYFRDGANFDVRNLQP